MSEPIEKQMKHRFRGFLPVVIDIETGGFNAATDAVLEIAATFFTLTEHGHLAVSHSIARNVDPFEGANLEPSAWNSLESTPRIHFERPSLKQSH